MTAYSVVVLASLHAMAFSSSSVEPDARLPPIMHSGSYQYVRGRAFHDGLAFTATRIPRSRPLSGWTPTEVVVKCADAPLVGSAMSKQIEYITLISQRYTWTPGVMDHFVDSGMECIALEFAGESLATVLLGPIGFSLRVSIAERMVQIVTELHEFGLIHGDIHGGNWLINDHHDPNSLQLIDFEDAQVATSEAIAHDMSCLHICISDEVISDSLAPDDESEELFEKFGQIDPDGLAAGEIDPAGKPDNDEVEFNPGGELVDDEIDSTVPAHLYAGILMRKTLRVLAVHLSGIKGKYTNASS